MKPIIGFPKCGAEFEIDEPLKSAPAVVNPQSVKKALETAVAAIYFNDSSDYEGALWDIVRHLDFATAELLADDEKKAYDTICGEAG